MATTSPTRWQRYGSPALTWVFHHLLFRPSRKALAGSIREGAVIVRLDQTQTENLVKLLAKHRILQLFFSDLPIENLKPYHFYNIPTQKRITAFLEEANQFFAPEFQFSFLAGQFSFRRIPEVVAPPPVVSPAVEPATDEQHQPTVIAALIGLLTVTNRPLSASEIRKAVQKEFGSKPPNQALLVEIGKLLERQVLIATHASKSEEVRYFLANRLLEVLGVTLFRYAHKDGAEDYIAQADAREMEAKGKVRRILDRDGNYYFSDAERIFDYVRVLNDSTPVFAARDDLPLLLEKGLLIYGLEEESLTPCYVYYEAQRSYGTQIFNAFAHPYLNRHYPGGRGEKYHKLRAAFEAGMQTDKSTSLNDLLYEARAVSEIGGDLMAVTVALTRREEALAFLPEGQHFSAAEIAYLRHCHQRLAFTAAFPFLFMPGWSHSLQNFIDFIYDSVDSYAVFQLLLVRKLAELRSLAVAGTPIPLPLKNTIEVVYAPLAEKHGFADLSNNMRDLVARLTDPESYTRARKMEEAVVGMEITQARRHLIEVAYSLAKEMQAELGLAYLPQVRTRVKEVSSFMGKTSLADRESFDILGIRYIGRNEAEAYAIAGFLQSHLKLAAKHAVADHLKHPNARGWRGWRGHFHDPHNERSFISFHVFTEEIEKEDKRGIAAHWGYKALRAAQALALSLGESYRHQVLDPVNLEDYNGDPEHDFGVDVRQARKHKRAFLFIADGPFSAKSFQFPSDGGLPILRLKPEETIEDAVAFKALGDFLTGDYQYAEVYLPVYDPISGAIVLRNFNRGQARVALGSTVPNGALVVLKNGSPLERASLAEVNRTAQSFRARLLTRIALSAKTRETLIGEGKSHPLAKLLVSAPQQQELLRFTEFLNIDEIWMAIALGLLNEDGIKQSLGVLTTTVTVSTLDKLNLAIRVDAPDRPGLLSYLLFNMQGWDILSLKSPEISRSQGVSPAHLELTVSPSHDRRVKDRKAGFDAAELKARLEEQPVAFSTNEINPLPITRLNLSITPAGRKAKHWNVVHTVGAISAALDMNILALELPPIASRLPGNLIVEIKSADPGKQVSQLKAELDKLSRFNFSVDEIH